MKNKLSLFLLFSLLLSFVACTTIYNYDLSISGLDDLPATKACLEKYLPKSIDAQKGKQNKELQVIALSFDNYQDEIIDSLISDSVEFKDNSYLLKFKIIATDPFDGTSEFDVEKQYFLHN